MAVNKVVSSFEEAIADISDGASVAVSGAQGPAGIPRNLLLTLVKKGTKNLTAIGYYIQVAVTIQVGCSGSITTRMTRQKRIVGNRKTVS